MNQPGELFTVSTVRKLAGSRSYSRGWSYHSDGRVEPVRERGPGLQATVRGTMPYAVRLWVDGGKPGWSCTCPAAEDGSFCKHCVAVALTLHPDATLLASESLVQAPESSPSPTPDHELPDFVGQLPKDRLVEIVLQQATSDWRLRESLLAEARAVRGDVPDVESWRRHIDNAFAPRDRYVSYREAGDWADGVDEVIDGLEELCDQGQPDAAAALAEYAHRRADEAVEFVDHSSGWMLDISLRLFDLHHRACAQGRPDPPDLAARLVRLELDSDLEGFYRTAGAYAEMLGEAGLAAYRDCLEQRRTQVEGRRNEGWRRDGALGRIHEAMVGWAAATGDPDILIEVHSRERLHPAAVMEIAEALIAADREDEALEWARRGLSENRGSYQYTAELREFLAGALRERGDSSGGIQLFWDGFSAAPSVTSYRRLLQQAGEDSGVEGGWAERCVEELQGRLAERADKADRRRRGFVASNKDALLKILLYEGRIAEAWQAATEYGCDRQMWLTLARARERTHPLEAIGVYEPEVFAQIDRVKTPAYEKAVDLMDRIRRLSHTADVPERFTTLLHRVRTEHRFKRNLKKLLDDRGW